MRKKLLRVLLSLFIINSLSLFVYLTGHHHDAPPTATDTFRLPSRNASVRKPSPGTSHAFQKPWPILPSYLPWTPPSSSPRTCEAFFGNGFSQRSDLLPSNGQGWLRCHHNPTLRASVCEGANVQMDTSKIHVSRGGEEIESVIGRNEDDEIPGFEEGAFEVIGGKIGTKLADDGFLDGYVPRGDLQNHPMRNLIASFRTSDRQSFHCEKWIEDPVLMVIRFEYANVFHTVTDWYSAYVACRVANLPYRPHLVFVDGHCTTQLEETWRALFSSVRYVKQFNGTVCFRRVVFAPIGYETALFKGLREEIDCEGTQAGELWRNSSERKTARLSEFGEMIRAGFGLRQVYERQQVYKVLFVRREDYLAHPRHGGKVESRLSNEEEVFLAVKRWAVGERRCKIRVMNGLLAHMALKDQVRAIQEAAVIVGAHGAGLTHIVGASPGAVILEIISSYFRRPHFGLIAKWKGLRYHAMNLHGSYASPEAVIAELGRIMVTIGC